MLLPQLSLHHTINNISLALQKSAQGELVLKSALPDVMKDSTDASMLSERLCLRQIEQMGCHVYEESDVAVVEYRRGYTYSALLGSTECSLRRASFLTSGKRVAHDFRDFFNDLKLHFALRDCAGVAPFLGVVMDDSRQVLKGYLTGHARIILPWWLFENTMTRNEIIPLSIRELWACQMIEAVIEIHDKVEVVGLISNGSFGIGPDGRAQLVNFTTSSGEIQDGSGKVPPEWRKHITDNRESRPRVFNQRHRCLPAGPAVVVCCGT